IGHLRSGSKRPQPPTAPPGPLMVAQSALGGLREAQGRRARPEGGRGDTGPPGAALGPPGVREREAAGLGRRPRAAAGAPAGPPRRARVPVRPPARPARRVRPAARPEPRPRARHPPDVGRQELKGQAIARLLADPAARSAVGVALTATGGERCREPTPP